MATLSPLRIWRGETKVWRFTLWTVVDGVDTRVDLSVYDDVEFQVKAAVDAADPALIAKNTSGGIVVLNQTVDETLGQLEVTLNPSDTSSMTSMEYQYDLWGLIGAERYMLARPASFTVEGVVNGAA